MVRTAVVAISVPAIPITSPGSLCMMSIMPERGCVEDPAQNGQGDGHADAAEVEIAAPQTRERRNQSVEKSESAAAGPRRRGRAPAARRRSSRGRSRRWNQPAAHVRSLGKSNVGLVTLPAN